MNHRPETNLRHREEWSGRHNGIYFKVSKHIMGGVAGLAHGTYPVWCYYISLHENQVPAEKLPAFFLEPKIETLAGSGRGYVRYHYTDSALGALDSWHGGITYYGYVSFIPGHRVVEAGCDWNHAWDNAEHDPYSLTCVERECRATVDELLELHPDLLVRCNWNGGYYPREEMEEWGDGYISAEGREQRDANRVKEAKA